MQQITELVEKYYQNLSERIRNWLKNERGLNNEIIERFKLGWDGKALTIPIYNQEGQYSFFKYRKDPHDTFNKPKYWYSPKASAEIYGWEHITEPKPALILCEGEFDRLILETHGFPAITSTSGAGTFKDEWIELFNTLPSEILICYDNDKAGLSGCEKIASLIPQARIVILPKLDGIKDITDFILTKGIDEFKKLLNEARTLEEVKEESRQRLRLINKSLFPPLSADELLDILGLTIKEDWANKLITFLCELSAYTEDSQFNISFNAPSSTGKSYIPMEIASLFPKEDVIEVGYCSPTAFFHDFGIWDKEKKGYVVDLSRRILIFLDQPHTLLLQHLRPFLSHDKKELQLKITDKSQKLGLRTKNIFLKGFPAVIFCTAGLKIDEQETTRFLLLSPETNQKKIRESIHEKVLKESDGMAYKSVLDSHPKRQLLKERIIAIKDEYMRDIKITSPNKIEEIFFKKNNILKPRHMRDIGRLIALVKAFALLNLWYRESEGSIIIANDEDIAQAFMVWEMISESQEFNIPPYVYNLFREVIIPAYEDKRSAITRKEIMQKHSDVYGRPLADWQLRQQIIPMLDTAGLIMQEPDPQDRRKILILPLVRNSESEGRVVKTIVSSTVG